jgi:hypothetical protein
MRYTNGQDFPIMRLFCAKAQNGKRVTHLHEKHPEFSFLTWLLFAI